ncbi:MAG: hypothetical protein Q9222_002939 [Ikaeria aurantiellina]
MYHFPIHLLPFFLLLPLLTLAVDIEISPTTLPDVDGSPGHILPFVSQRCRGIPPGVCCKQRPDLHNAAFPNKRIKFTGLDALDIAAAWTDRGPVGGCSGTPKATYAGGGNWEYLVPVGETDLFLRGGNYLRMPVGVPDEKDRGWLEGEGVKGFVWGQGDWFSQTPGTAAGARNNLLAAARAQLGSGSSGHPLGWRRMGKRIVDFGRVVQEIGGRGLRLGKRGIRSPEKGVVFCGGPRRAMWVDEIFVDGVEYKCTESQGAVYVSGDGKVLNYTGVAEPQNSGEGG